MGRLAIMTVMPSSLVAKRYLRRVLGEDRDLRGATAVGERCGEMDRVGDAIDRDKTLFRDPWQLAHLCVGETRIDDGDFDSLVLDGLEERKGKAVHSVLRCNV